MPTRARIGIELEDGSILSSYHHLDGYPSWLGVLLQEAWTDREKVERAICLGDARTWGLRVSVEDQDDAETSVPGATLVNQYYERDLGHPASGPKRNANMTELENNICCGEEYVYVLRLDGRWMLLGEDEPFDGWILKESGSTQKTNK